MSTSRFRLKTLGLCAVLVGVMTFGGVAQAEPGSFWKINGAQTKSAAPIEAETDIVLRLLVELGGKPFHLACQTILVNGSLSSLPGQILGNILFHGCRFFQLLTAGGVAHELKACEPSVNLGGGVIHKGLIQTNEITGLIKLHGGTSVIEVKPTTGSTFTTLNLGEECGFGELMKIEGIIFLQDSNGQFLTEAVKHLVSELPKLTKIKINGGAVMANLDGSVWAFLGAPNKGLKFSGQPEEVLTGEKFWLVAGAAFLKGLLPAVEAKTDVTLKLLGEVGGKPLHITCQTTLFTGAYLVEPLAAISGKILFHGCKFFQLLTAGGVAHELKACEPLMSLEGGKVIHKGLIQTNAITGSIKLHGGIGVIEAKPTTAGQPFATIVLGEECAFGSEIKVEGVFFLQDTNGKFSDELVEHLVSELPALTAMKVNGGASTAKLDGSLLAFLGGAHNEWTFSGIPG